MPTPEATATHRTPPAGKQVAAAPADAPSTPATSPATTVREIGGPAGPEPTRYGDWEKAGRCIDF
jgi:hypothetical protein